MLKHKKLSMDINPVDRVLTKKITGLTQKGMKLIFYPGRHDLTRIDPVNSVLVKNDGFDPKRPETHFLPWSTWFDPY
jgi:hypothetical protein